MLQKARLENIERKFPKPDPNDAYLTWMLLVYKTMKEKDEFSIKLKSSTRDFLRRNGVDTDFIDRDERIYFWDNCKVGYRTFSEQAALDAIAEENKIYEKELLKLRDEYFGSANIERKAELKKEMAILDAKLGIERSH